VPYWRPILAPSHSTILSLSLSDENYFSVCICLSIIIIIFVNNYHIKRQKSVVVTWLREKNRDILMMKNVVGWNLLLKKNLTLD
jgi:hypothetical protein